MIKNFNTLADRLKGITLNGKEITADELKTFMSSDEEVEIKVSKVHLLTDSELDDVKGTVSTGAKDKGFVDGMKAGAEQLVKAIRNVKGLEFEGKLKYSPDVSGLEKIDFPATAEHVSKYFEEKILADAKIEPDKTIKELDGKLKKVQSTYDEEKQSWDKKLKEFETEKKVLKQDYFMETKFPDVTSLSKKHLVTCFKADGFNVDFDENGNAFPVQFGKRVVDRMEKPIPIETAFAEYIEKNNWNKKPAGKGGDDDKPEPSPDFKTKNEVMAYLEANKMDIESDEAQKMIKKVEKKT
jgi:hypothetical protein